MTSLPSPVKDQIDRSVWLAYMERKMRNPRRDPQIASQYNPGQWLFQVSQRFRKRAIRTAQGRFMSDKPPENYYKGASGAEYLVTRLILEKAQQEYGFLDNFFYKHGLSRGYAHDNNLDPKFIGYLPDAMHQAIQTQQEGLKLPGPRERKLLEEWKTFLGDPQLTDEQVTTFVEQVPGAEDLGPEDQKLFAEWDDLIHQWSDHYQYLLSDVWATPEYRELLSREYSPTELTKAREDPLVESKSIWEEYRDDIFEDNADYIQNLLVQFYENNPAAGLGFIQSFGMDERKELWSQLQSHYGVTSRSELEEYTARELPLSDEEREFYRWYAQHKDDLDKEMELVPSAPLSLLMQDIEGGEYEIPLGKIDPTQESFAALQSDLEQVFSPVTVRDDTSWIAPAAVVYVREDGSLMANPDLEQLAYQAQFGGDSGQPGNIIFLEMSNMSQEYLVQAITPGALHTLRTEYAPRLCQCPIDGRVYDQVEESCELQECAEHPGIFLESQGPPLFGNIIDKLTGMQDEGETIYSEEDIGKALESVENTVVSTEPNTVVYYALTGPLAQDAKVRGGLGILESETGDTIFLPSAEVTEGFQVVDSIPDDLFHQLRDTVASGITIGLPSLSQLREKGHYVAHDYDAVAEEVMRIDDALNFAASNIVLYYAEAGPIGWGIRNQSEATAPLGVYGEDVLLLPTKELSEGFTVIDGISNEQFAQIKEAPPELSQIQGQEYVVDQTIAEQQLRALIEQLSSAARAGQTPITIEINPASDFYRHEVDGTYPSREAMDSWIKYLEGENAELDIIVDIVTTLEEPFAIPTYIPGETEAAKLPRTAEVLYMELIKSAQGEEKNEEEEIVPEEAMPVSEEEEEIVPEEATKPVIVDSTLLYIAYLEITGESPQSFEELQLALIQDAIDAELRDPNFFDPSLASQMAQWISKYEGSRLVTVEDVYDLLDISDVIPQERRRRVRRLEAPYEPIMEAPKEVEPTTPEPFEPLSDEALREEFEQLQEKLPDAATFLTGREDVTGLQVYVSPSLWEARGEELFGERAPADYNIIDYVRDRTIGVGLPAPEDIGLEISVMTPDQFDKEQAAQGPVFYYQGAEVKETEEETRPTYDITVVEKGLSQAVQAAEYMARQMPEGELVIYTHPDLVEEVGQEWLEYVVQNSVKSPFDTPGKVHFIEDTNVSAKGFEVLPASAEKVPSSGISRTVSDSERLPMPEQAPDTGDRTPAEYPPEVADEFLRTRKGYDAQMELALEDAIVSFTTQESLFMGADATALLESGKRRTTLLMPEELQQIFYNQGIQIARDTTMWPIGPRDLMLTGEDQSYYLKVSPDGFMDAYVLSSEYENKEDVDDLLDGQQAALSYINTVIIPPTDMPAPTIEELKELPSYSTQIVDYWEQKIQPNKNDAFCTGWSATMQLYGIPLTRTINIGDPERPDVRRTNGRADAVGFIWSSLEQTQQGNRLDVDRVRERATETIRNSRLPLNDPYIQGMFEGFSQEGYPPTLLGYENVSQLPIPTAPDVVEQEQVAVKQFFVDQAVGKGYSSDAAEAAWNTQILPKPAVYQQILEQYNATSQPTTSASRLPVTEAAFYTELIKSAADSTEVDYDSEYLQQLVEDVSSPAPEEALPEEAQPGTPLEDTFPEVTERVEEEYANIFNALQVTDWQNTEVVYVYAHPVLEEFIGGTVGLQDDLVAEGWDQELANRVFVSVDEDLGPRMLYRISPLPITGFRHEDGEIWNGTEWLIPEDQIYEFNGIRFKLLNKPPFGTQQPLYPVEVVWAPEGAITEQDKYTTGPAEVGKEYTMPIEWLQEATPVSSSEPTGEELVFDRWGQRISVAIGA